MNQAGPLVVYKGAVSLTLPGPNWSYIGAPGENLSRGPYILHKVLKTTPCLSPASTEGSLGNKACRVCRFWSVLLSNIAIRSPCIQDIEVTSVKIGLLQNWEKEPVTKFMGIWIGDFDYACLKTVLSLCYSTVVVFFSISSLGSS